MWPSINDITTDQEQASEAQRRAYPDVRPLLLNAPADRVFDEAVAAGRALGWSIVVADRAARRLEAVATTRLLRFKDDVVVTLREEELAGFEVGRKITRVDVRSKSRIGRGDLGTNARRIRRFLDRLRRPFLV